MEVRRKLRGIERGALSGLNLGLSTRWISGFPLNAYGHSFLYANWEYYLVPRGWAGRGPSIGKPTCR